jgi:NADP-dependent 3-hydroxy acid dehydrogenase YdfG
MRFIEKVALVTGATSGIGKATAQLFAKEGARVGVLGQDKQNVDETIAEFEQAGYEVMPLAADVVNARSMQQALEQLVQRCGIIFGFGCCQPYYRHRKVD